MTLIKRDSWSNQLEAINIPDAVEYTVERATLGYEEVKMQALAMTKKQTVILQNLISILVKKNRLTEKEVLQILEEPSLMLGVEQ